MNWLGARLIDVPQRLDEVSTRVARDESHPEAAGLRADAVERIWHSVEKLYRTGAYPAITICLRRRGHIVLNRAIGHAAGNGPDEAPTRRKRLARPDTPVCVFSSSKAITAILIHKLAEEGGLRLDQRVSHFIPEFAAQGKSDTTLSQVLSHRGGFPMFDLPRSEIRPEILTDWQHCIDVICRAPPTHRRTPRLSYHAITGGYILAEVLQRVTQRPISEYLDEKIRRPMGMRTFTFGLAPEHRRRVALNYVAGAPVRFPISHLLERALMLPMDQVVDVSNSKLFYDAVIPAGNLYATAEEMSRFFQMLLDGGVYDGRRILATATVERAVRPAGPFALDRTLMLPMRYSEGLMLGANPFGLYGPMSARAFGHLGFMNILGWADPQRELSGGLLVTGKAVLGGHLLALGQLLTTIVWQCRN